MTVRMTTTSFSRGLRWRIAFHVAVAVLSFVAIVAMVNYLSARHFMRFHWSDRADVKLTPRTLSLLKAMTNEVEITVFFDSESPLHAPVARVLEEYLAASPRLTVRKVDPYRNPAAAQGIRTRFNLDPEIDDSMVIFSHGERTRIITERMLAEYEFEQVPNPEEYEVKKRYRAFRGELMFTSAIADVIAQRQLKTYFLAGHHEHSPTSAETQMGYAGFGELLRENNIAFDFLNLGPSGEIPRDCDLLIIAGPRTALLPSELDRVEQYLNQGGRLLALFNSEAEKLGTGLERLLLQWGIVVGRNLVEDAAYGHNGQAAIFQTARYGRHPIVAPLGDVRLTFVFPRTIAARRDSAAGLAGATVTELVFSSTNAVVLSEIRDGQFTRTGRDERGEFPLAVAVEKGGLPGVVTQRGGVTRIVAVGDSFLFGNEILNYLGNRDFASQLVNWLLDRSELMAGIGPRPMIEYQLALTPSQLRMIRWVLVAGLPLAALLAGVVVWLRRRS
ncbi:MAG TPA: hypothetical protein DCY13_12040 [Verrucomicrobiales bacterium]|nr:hypothetical protein [Verrucomicrobiales bacterium]